MCGIAGAYSSTPLDSASMGSMVEALSHRGPDARGLYFDPSRTMALGHTRLSIIDLSTDANQPFYSSDGRHCVVFNGEIYNFQQIKKELADHHGTRFRTHSDTEVILESFLAWGIKMVERLEGMFAIALVDQQARKMFFFRDRIGKKPLYYFQSPGLFVFASEIKSLLKHPAVQHQKKVNRKIITSFLHLGYIPEPHTIYSNIHKFPSGHTGELDHRLTLNVQPYWQVSDKLETPRIHNAQEAKDHLGKLLDESVERRLISNVPLGTFLSGGIDSSLVTAIAAQHVTSPLRTFSIGFRESKFDESSHARAVARHLKTNHTEYILPQREAVDLLETYLRHFDEPFADTSAIPTMLVSKLARKEVKVVLTGDGGDELFQGYGAYTWADRLETVPWKMIKRTLRTVLQASGQSRWQRVARLLENPVGGLRSHIFSQENYFFSQKEIQESVLIRESDYEPFRYDESFLSGKDFGGGERQALFDLRYYLKDDLLVKVDRASMCYALECRCPILDHAVVEYALSLDRSLKKRNGVSKWILKELLYQYVPRELVDRPKWGFSVPLAHWMKNDLRYLVDECLSKQVIEDVGLFNSNYIESMVTEFFHGKDYLYNRLWVICVLHKWWKENA